MPKGREEQTVKNEGDRHRWMGAVVLLLTGLACRPVVAIGWSELVIVLVVAVVLLGPLLFRLYRMLVLFQSSENARDSEGVRRKGQSK